MFDGNGFGFGMSVIDRENGAVVVDQVGRIRRRYKNRGPDDEDCD